MFKTKPVRICFAVASAIALGFAASLSAADNFTANRTVVQPGETLELTYTADQAKSQDVYLAVLLDNTLLFMNQNGGFDAYKAGVATPARLKSPPAGSYKLLSFAMPEGFFYDATVYLAAGTPGSDLLAPGNYDAASLRSMKLSFTQKPATPAASDGRSLYATHCAACHDTVPATNTYNILKGTNPAVTINAIQKDMGGMGYLTTLSNDEINTIAAWISNPN